MKVCSLVLMFVLFAGCQKDEKSQDWVSGLNIYVDDKTGCQYLSTAIDGGLTPRLDKNGKPMCGI